MTQLRRGARQVLDLTIAELNDASDMVKRNPEAARERIERAIERIRDDITPMLQRAAPDLEKKIEEQGQRLDKIEDVLEQMKQQPFRKAGTG